MTAITQSALPRARGNESGRRIIAVLRLLLVDRAHIFYQPLATLGGIFLLNLAIWWVIIIASGAHATNHLGYSGASAYIYVYAIVIAVQVIMRTFPFALGFGVTRRDFYLGAAVTFVVLSVFYAAVLAIMSSIEIATHGWGIGGRMFAPLYFTDSSWFLRFLMAFLVFLFCLFVGSALATVYLRWRAIGIVIFFAVLAVVIVAAVAEVTLGHQWGSVGNWFGREGAFGVTVWTLVPSAVAAIAGFLVLRRITPKS